MSEPKKPADVPATTEGVPLSQFKDMSDVLDNEPAPKSTVDIVPSQVKIRSEDGTSKKAVHEDGSAAVLPTEVHSTMSPADQIVAAAKRFRPCGDCEHAVFPAKESEEYRKLTATIVRTTAHLPAHIRATQPLATPDCYILCWDRIDPRIPEGHKGAIPCDMNGPGCPAWKPRKSLLRPTFFSRLFSRKSKA